MANAGAAVLEKLGGRAWTGLKRAMDGGFWKGKTVMGGISELGASAGRAIEEFGKSDFGKAVGRQAGAWATKGGFIGAAVGGYEYATGQSDSGLVGSVAGGAIKGAAYGAILGGLWGGRKAWRGSIGSGAGAGVGASAGARDSLTVRKAVGARQRTMAQQAGVDVKHMYGAYKSRELGKSGNFFSRLFNKSRTLTQQGKANAVRRARLRTVQEGRTRIMNEAAKGNRPFINRDVSYSMQDGKIDRFYSPRGVPDNRRLYRDPSDFLTREDLQWGEKINSNNISPAQYAEHENRVISNITSGGAVTPETEQFLTHRALRNIQTRMKTSVATNTKLNSYAPRAGAQSILGPSKRKTRSR